MSSFSLKKTVFFSQTPFMFLKSYPPASINRYADPWNHINQKKHKNSSKSDKLNEEPDKTPAFSPQKHRHAQQVLSFLASIPCHGSGLK